MALSPCHGIWRQAEFRQGGGRCQLLICLSRPKALWYWVHGRQIRHPTEIRKHAKKLLPRDVWNFGDGAARARSRSAAPPCIDRLAIRQDILVDSARSTCARRYGATAVVARRHRADGRAHPLHPEGDREMARGGRWRHLSSSRARGLVVEDVAKAERGRRCSALPQATAWRPTSSRA